MDPVVQQRLERMTGPDNNQQIVDLKSLVVDAPYHTAPAIILLDTMRRAGLLSERAEKSVAPTEAIPKRIVQFWHSKTPPPDVAELMASWREQQPDYDYFIFDDASAAEFLLKRGLAAERNALRRAKSATQRADLFRLAYLAVEGGFYVDADDRCIASIDHFVRSRTQFASYQEPYGTIANNFIGAVPGHAIVVAALHAAVEAVNRGDHDIIWLSTGPGLLTRAFARWVTQVSHDALKEVTILELWEAQRFIGIHCLAEYKRSREHWSRAAFGSARSNNNGLRRVHSS
jgi:mannosyltransferase OCH1-like enzyme